MTETASNYSPQVDVIEGEGVAVGYALGYSTKQIQSLMRSAYEWAGIPFVIIMDCDDESKNMARKYGGQIIDPYYPSGWSPSPAFRRILETLLVIKSFPKTVQNVIWCDTRDVIFQANPFLRQNHAELTLFSEAHSPAIGATATGRWLERALGREAIQETSTKMMANCGVMIGNIHKTMEFLKNVVMLGATTRYRLSKTPGLGLDQALFNYTAQSRLFDGAVVEPNLGRVANLYGVSSEKITFDQKGKLCASRTAEPFDVVHMFDRIPMTRQWAQKTFGWFDKPVKPPSNVERLSTRMKASILKRLPELRRA